MKPACEYLKHFNRQAHIPFSFFGYFSIGDLHNSQHTMEDFVPSAVARTFENRKLFRISTPKMAFLSLSRNRFVNIWLCNTCPFTIEIFINNPSELTFSIIAFSKFIASSVCGYKYLQSVNRCVFLFWQNKMKVFVLSVTIRRAYSSNVSLIILFYWCRKIICEDFWLFI